MLDVSALQIEFFQSRLERRNPIAYVRYGDGEFNAILGKKGENCDHHEYFPAMGEELANTLLHPRRGKYMYGIGPKAARNVELRDEVGTWVEVNTTDIRWNTSEVFLQASLDGRLGGLVAEMRRHKILWLAPDHMTKFLLREARWLHLTAPSRNAWLDKKALKYSVEWMLLHHKGIDAVVFCAGMVSKILIWELFPEWGNRVQLWDMGSVFDMYCGVDSRSYARRMGLAHKAYLLKANFGIVLEEEQNVRPYTPAQMG